MSGKRIMLASVNLDGISTDYEWYAVVTNYNMEEQYVRNVMSAVANTKLEKEIAEYYVPIKYTLSNPKAVEKGEKPKIKREKGCYASYVFVRCRMDSVLWNLLRTTTGASIIITTGGIPIPTPDEEIEDIKVKMAPAGFEFDKAIDLLIKDYRNYVKIIPGYNDDHPELCPEPDRESFEEWYKYALHVNEKIEKRDKKHAEQEEKKLNEEIAKKKKELQQKYRQKPKTEPVPKKEYRPRPKWNDMRNKFGHMNIQPRKFDPQEVIAQESMFDK